MLRIPINTLLRLLPLTRAYLLKARLLKLAGYDVHHTARFVSSVRVIGRFKLTVGPEAFVGHEVMIVGGESEITLGSDVDIGPRVLLATGTHEIDMEGPSAAGRGYSQDITIEDGVWIGAGSTILGGVTIGRNAVIAAGSVVTRSIPAFTLAAGCPCRPKKVWCRENKSWVSLQDSQRVCA